MNKSLLYFLVLCSINLSAQGVVFGVKAGLNFANISDDSSQDFDARTSFHFGFTSEIVLSDTFSLQPELNYSEQGYADTDYTVKINYINLPLMAKYYLAEHLNIEVGPQLNFLTNAEIKSDNGSFEVKQIFRSNVFDLNFGLGYKFDSGLNFNLRYLLGLSDMTVSEQNKIKNRVLLLSVGFQF